MNGAGGGRRNQQHTQLLSPIFFYFSTAIISNSPPSQGVNSSHSTDDDDKVCHQLSVGSSKMESNNIFLLRISPAVIKISWIVKFALMFYMGAAELRRVSNPGQTDTHSPLKALLLFLHRVCLSSGAGGKEQPTASLIEIPWVN